MKKSIFLLCALTAPALIQAETSVISESSEIAYLVDVIVNKGDELVSYSKVTLVPMSYGQTATATFGGKTHQLKYSGSASVAQSNGKTTQHEFLYVTEDNRFIANIYRADYCGEMALDEAWPLTHQEYHVPSDTGDCILTLRYQAVNAGKF